MVWEVATCVETGYMGTLYNLLAQFYHESKTALKKVY